MSGKEVRRVTQVAVRIDPDLWKTVRLEAVQKGTSASAIVAEALQDWLKKQQTK